jgi:hypothetical protein
VAFGGIVGGDGVGAPHDLCVKPVVGKLHRTGFRHSRRPGVGKYGNTVAVDAGNKTCVRLFPVVVVDVLCRAAPGLIVPFVGFKEFQIGSESVVDPVESVGFGGLLGGGESDKRTDEADPGLHFGEKIHP